MVGAGVPMTYASYRSVQTIHVIIASLRRLYLCAEPQRQESYCGED